MYKNKPLIINIEDFMQIFSLFYISLIYFYVQINSLDYVELCRITI